MSGVDGRKEGGGRVSGIDGRKEGGGRVSGINVQWHCNMYLPKGGCIVEITHFVQR